MLHSYIILFYHKYIYKIIVVVKFENARINYSCASSKICKIHTSNAIFYSLLKLCSKEGDELVFIN